MHFVQLIQAYDLTVSPENGIVLQVVKQVENMLH